MKLRNILQRMRELAVQAANDTNSTADRTSIASEITALTAEIDRIANTTSWAGQMLLDGATPDATVTTDNDAATFVFQIGSGVTAADELSVSINSTGSTALGIAGSGNPPSALTDTTSSSTVTANTGTMAVVQSTGKVTFAGTATAADDFTLKINGTEVNITVSGSDTYEVSVAGVAQQMKEAIDAANIAGVSVTRARCVDVERGRRS
jgi:flagellin